MSLYSNTKWKWRQSCLCTLRENEACPIRACVGRMLFYKTEYKDSEARNVTSTSTNSYFLRFQQIKLQGYEVFLNTRWNTQLNFWHFYINPTLKTSVLQELYPTSKRVFCLLSKHLVVDYLGFVIKIRCFIFIMLGVWVLYESLKIHSCFGINNGSRSLDFNHWYSCGDIDLEISLMPNTLSSTMLVVFGNLVQLITIIVHVSVAPLQKCLKFRIFPHITNVLWLNPRYISMEYGLDVAQVVQ